MPELPEVETVRRGLAPTLVGARIDDVEMRRADLRFPFPEHFVERLTGRRVDALTRRAKYLAAELDSRRDAGDASRHVRLVPHRGRGDAGRVPFRALEGAAHDHVVFTFESGARVVYNDPRRFG